MFKILLRTIFIVSSLFIFFYTHSSFAVEQNKNTKQLIAQSQGQDQEIVNFLVALDNNEVASAKIALSRSLTARVRDYANMMIADHKKHLQTIRDFMQKNNIPVKSNLVVLKLEANGKAQATNLSITRQTKFDVTYMQSMINDHKAALDSINQYLSSMKGNDALKAILEKTRNAVSEHLTAAQAILTNLQK